MAKNPAPIPFAGSELTTTRHVCAFFSNEEEEYRVLLPFIKDGFECGDRAIHVVNPDQRDDHLARLSSAGIDTVNAEQNGQFEVRINNDMYLSDGRFDADRMLEMFEQVASGNVEGFPLSRIVCHMDWATQKRSYIEDLIEFESRVNDVWLRHDDAVICTYNLGKFGGDTVIDMIRTHPMIIVGGILHENPFFVPPEQFLKEYRERRSRQTRPTTS
jgi:hypothetical protein